MAFEELKAIVCVICLELHIVWWFHILSYLCFGKNYSYVLDCLQFQIKMKRIKLEDFMSTAKLSFNFVGPQAQKKDPGETLPSQALA